MKNFKKLVSVVLTLVMVSGLFAGCAKDGGGAGDAPAKVTIWTYYNGTAKVAFDASVEEFNKTAGKKENVVVEAYSQGDVNELADAVLRAAKGDTGAEEMPDVFAAYSDSAYQIDKLGLVADVGEYFTEEELSEFRKEFLEEGKFGENGELKIVPVAKSTENLFVNVTDFNRFAEFTGSNLEEFSTWESILALSEAYYDWSGGKALFGVDAMANFMLISSMQLGEDFYVYGNEAQPYRFSKETGRKIWDSFYVPYVKGYYAATGRFRSDDAKTGDVLAFTGSSAGSSYFPEQVEMGLDETYPIECAVLPYPHYENSSPAAMQQGAGMVITKSDKAQEEAAALFLKWFTEDEQNLKFSAATGYMPVKNNVMNIKEYQRKVEEEKIDMNSASMKSAETTLAMFEDVTLYENKPMEKSYEMRQVLEHSLVDYANADMEKIKEMIADGVDRQEAAESYISDENFNNWYVQFIAELDKALSL